jgi:membrane associated rhomboid family serine protease
MHPVDLGASLRANERCLVCSGTDEPSTISTAGGEDVGLLMIFWLPILVAAILGGSLSIRFASEQPPTRPLLGASLVVVGLVAALAGFGSMWLASEEGQSLVPAAAVFLTGAAGMLIGSRLLNGRVPGTARH